MYLLDGHLQNVIHVAVTVIDCDASVLTLNFYFFF